jgi:hypothetical protein
MERTYLQLNVVNTISIVIMASIGILALGFIQSAIKTYRGGSAPGQ